MAKTPTVTTVQSGFNSQETINANFQALAEAFTNTVSRDGSTPNTMEASLDLNGQDIIGVNNITADRLVINGQLVAVTADPVFDGTITDTGVSLLSAANPAAARTTLELGSVATTDVSEYATAAQGVTADTAVQPNDNVTLGDVTLGDVTAGAVVATSFTGDGSGLTNAGAFTIVQQGTISTASYYVNFTNLDFINYSYVLFLDGIQGTAAATFLGVGASSNNGSSWVTGGYSAMMSNSTAVSSTVYTKYTTASSIPVGITTDATGGTSAVIHLSTKADSSELYVTGHSVSLSGSNNMWNNHFAGRHIVSLPNAIRFFFTSGNVGAGKYTLMRREI